MSGRPDPNQQGEFRCNHCSGSILVPLTRTATVELEWAGTDSPQLAISRFVCWEILGLGGQDGSIASH